MERDKDGGRRGNESGSSSSHRDSGRDGHSRRGDGGERGKIFRDRDRERERERDREERGYRGHGGRRDRRQDKDQGSSQLETKRPIILAKHPAQGDNKEKYMERKVRDEEFPTLAQAHHRDSVSAGKSPPSDKSDKPEDRIFDGGKLLVGRERGGDSGTGRPVTIKRGGGETTGGNHLSSDKQQASLATPQKSISPRPEDLRVTDLLSMDEPPYKEKVRIWGLGSVIGDFQ